MSLAEITVRPRDLSRQAVILDLDRAIELYTQAGEQGAAEAHSNLGLLLQDERQDVDGAEKAYCAAIEADPGHTIAHSGLGALRIERALDIEHEGGDLEEASALCDQAVRHYEDYAAAGGDRDYPQRAKAVAKRLRAAARAEAV